MKCKVWDTHITGLSPFRFQIVQQIFATGVRLVKIDGTA